MPCGFRFLRFPARAVRCALKERAVAIEIGKSRDGRRQSGGLESGRHQRGFFLGAFRNHCGFHEDVTVGIGQRLSEEMKPQWLRIGGYWYPRGGMPIDVFWQSGLPPEGLWLPDQGVAPYRGRG